MLDKASFLIKYEPPVEISFSSLNHLTARGTVPVKADFKEIVEPSFTSRLSGFTVKAGGSRKTMLKNSWSWSSSTYSRNGSLCSYTDQWYLNVTFLTFDTESSSLVLLTSNVGQSASIIASITLPQAPYKESGHVLPRFNLIFCITVDLFIISVPTNINWLGPTEFAFQGNIITNICIKFL